MELAPSVANSESEYVLFVLIYLTVRIFATAKIPTVIGMFTNHILQEWEVTIRNAYYHVWTQINSKAYEGLV